MRGSRFVVALGAVAALGAGFAVAWASRTQSLLPEPEAGTVAQAPDKVLGVEDPQRRARAAGGGHARIESVRQIGTEDGPFAMPHDLAVNDASLVVLDRGSLIDGLQVLTFERATGSLVGTAGRKGEGPADVGAAQSVQVDLDQPEFVWVNDYKNGRMAQYEAANLSAGPAQLVRFGGAPFQAFWTRQGLMMTGQFATEVLRRYARTGSDLTMDLAIGPLALEASPSDVSSDWNRASMAVHPDGTRLALSFVFLDELRIYGADGTWEYQMHGPEVIEPDYHDRQWGYLYVTASSDLVFALFVGGSSDSVVIASTDLHVFTWEGEFVGRVELSEPIDRPAIAPDGRTLYGIRTEPYPAVVEFEPIDLPALRGKR